MASKELEAVCLRVQDKVLKQLATANHVDVGVIDDSELATIAMWQEYGWVQRVTNKQSYWFKGQGIRMPPGSSLVLPPRPFFRATVASCSQTWAKSFAQAMKSSAHDTKWALFVVGTKATEDIKDTMINGGTSQERFPERAPITQILYANEAKGHRLDGTGNISTTKPLVKTGALLNAIGFQVKHK